MEYTRILVTNSHWSQTVDNNGHFYIWCICSAIFIQNKNAHQAQKIVTCTVELRHADNWIFVVNLLCECPLTGLQSFSFCTLYTLYTILLSMLMRSNTLDLSVCVYVSLCHFCWKIKQKEKRKSLIKCENSNFIFQINVY